MHTAIRSRSRANTKTDSGYPRPSGLDAGNKKMASQTNKQQSQHQQLRCRHLDSAYFFKLQSLQ